MGERIITWPGFYNARDLGGLPTTDGALTASGAFIRSARTDFVMVEGWEAAVEAGFTTLIELRENEGPPRRLPPEIAWHHIDLNDPADQGFWQEFWDDGRWATPLYYPAFLRAKSERVAAVFTTLAQAPSGVIFNCWAGRDRTGLIAVLLQRLAGVTDDAVVADFEASTEGVAKLYSLLRHQDQSDSVRRVFERHGSSPRRALLEAVGDLDVRAYLIEAGVEAGDVEALRTRLRPKQ